MNDTAALKLSTTQRQRFFAGETPAVRGEGPCPVEVGHVHPLSSKLYFTVLAITRKADRWALRYEVTDKRDKVRSLRRTPPVHSEGAVVPTDEKSIAHAAEESAYTSAHAQVVDNAGEAVDILSQRRFTQQAHDNASHQSAANQARRERHELDQRLQRVREEARLQGIDISSPERVIERQLAKIERRVYDGKAA